MSAPWTRMAAVGAATALTATAPVIGVGPASAATAVPRPDRFTSAYTVTATPDSIIDATGASVRGQPGASGAVDLFVDAERDVICWDMDVRGLQGRIGGPGETGVAIREAPDGYGGPPRIEVPAPEREGDRWVGSGCARGPFATGLPEDDGGGAFSLADIEADPSDYAVDVRTSEHPEGAIRGQLSLVPLGGPAAGQGGLAAPSETRVGLGLVAAAGVVAAGAAGWRRTRVEA